MHVIKFSYDNRDNRSDLEIYRRLVLIKPVIWCRVICFPRRGLDLHGESFLERDTKIFRTVLLEALNTHGGRLFANQITYTYCELVWNKNRDQENERGRGFSDLV